MSFTHLIPFSSEQRWSELSTVAHVVSVENTSHDIQLDHPDVVIDAVIGLLP